MAAGRGDLDAGCFCEHACVAGVFPSDQGVQIIVAECFCISWPPLGVWNEITDPSETLIFLTVSDLGLVIILCPDGCCGVRFGHLCL